ncbi:MAG TPA: crosslink repair DNA glycosylase YcaQ family protein [Streptosporangiaceae bacterium]|nr:crosslink repair DNA glycosylase YcaQ family protein [Streptosporangiaceae bacterium]
MLSDERLRRYRLAAQRLTPPTAAADAADAARAVIGIQAQDVRAAGLALGSRVPGLRRADVERSGLVRTWTVRGTVHLIDPGDLPWLDAVLGPRNRARFDTAMRDRGDYEVAVGMLDDIVALLAERPWERAGLLEELARRGHGILGQRSINVLMPWAAAQGLVVGLPDGRYRAAQPPPAVDADLALATLARRYLGGYGPAAATDLASWSGLPLSTARRALAALGHAETAGELLALPGTLDTPPPPAPPALLLAAFDTTMLGWRTREPLVAAAHDRNVLPGGGMLRPVVLIDGQAAGTWSLSPRAAQRTVTINWFGHHADSPELRAEKRRVEAFLRPG